MKRYSLGLLSSFAFAGAVVTAQTATPPPTTPPQTPAQTSRPADAQKPEQVTITGCLVQGSGPDVFIIENARRRADDKTEKAMTYILASDPAVKDLNLRTHLNQRVRIVGTLDPGTTTQVGTGMGSSGAGSGMGSGVGTGTGAGTTTAQTTAPRQRPDEKTLTKFTTKTVTTVSDRCEPALVR